MSYFRLFIALCLLRGSLPAQSQPTIRVTTRLVQVSVVAHDHAGAPVADLKKEDFTVFEKGKPQKIAVFTADVTDGAATPWVKMPPNIYSNRFQSVSTPANITVILFDGLNTRFSDQAYARAQILRFIGQIQPQDRVAIYLLLERRLHILHDFTNNPEHLAQALAKYRGNQSATLDASEPPTPSSGDDAMDRFLSGSNQIISDFAIQQRVEWTLDAMEAIAHHLKALPGRKNLVWVSGGFPSTLGLDVADFAVDTPARMSRNFVDTISRVARAMSDANLAIYPVDERGLMVDPKYSAETNAAAARPDPRRPPQTFRPQGLDTMQLLADRTGGRAFINRNDLDQAIRIAVNDARVTYTLGFYCSDDEWDGKFHDIKVKVDRKGVDVRYRKGFIALANPVPAERDLSAEVANLLSSPLEATSIGVNARTDVVDKPKPGTFLVTVQITPEDIYFQHQNDRWLGNIDVMFVQYGAEGKGLDKVTQNIAMTLPQARYDEVRQRGLLFNKSVEVAKDAEDLRVVVLDRSTGNIGSLRFPVHTK